MSGAPPCGGLEPGAFTAVTGKWIVTVTGAVQTSCIATVTETRSGLAGLVSCREAGVEFRIDGAARGDVVSGATPAGVSWTVSRDGTGLVGTYQSPRGSGTWSAKRASTGG